IWILLCTFFYVTLLAIKHIQFGLEFIIFVWPMSALPFIVGGVPQAALNHIFICRSLIVVFAFLLSVSWFLQNFMQAKREICFLFLTHFLVFFVLYAITLLGVNEETLFNAINALIGLFFICSFFYFFITWVRGYSLINRILKVFALSCVLQAILSFLSYYYYVVLGGEDSFSFTGLLRDYELFAEYLAVHVPIFFFLIRNEDSKFLKNVFRVGLMLVLLVLIATVIRGALVALFVAMGFYLWRLRKITGLGYVVKTICYGVLLIGVIILVVHIFIPESSRIIERFLETDLSTGDSRRFVWVMFLDYFKEKPFFGHGMFYDLPTAELFWPHSTYFYFLLTLGIPGLLNFLILIIRLIKKGFENIRRSVPVSKHYEMAIAIQSAFFIIIIDGLKVGYQRYLNYQLFVWMVFGLIAAFYFTVSKEGSSVEDS
ncbi:MAG: O-antigen ligase domain-containing protein, partial [Candidatus Moranbacteria bacterium]|nr:O-antigen ligase domain-containing protein [Candidatus Moranbacteria bacterium]